MSRASLCIERGGRTYRLAWFSESRSGIYLGSLGAGRDFHYSYHADGRRHFKDGAEKQHESRSSRLNDHVGHLQVLSENIPLSSAWLNERTLFTTDGRSDTLVLVEDSAAADSDSLWVDWFLVDRGGESEFVASIERWAAKDPVRKLTGLHAIPLAHYPNHQVYFAIWIGNSREGPQRQ